MKKIVFLLSTIVLALNASGQFTKNIGLENKRRLSLLNTGRQAGKEERTFFASRHKAPENIPLKSMLEVRQKMVGDSTEFWDANADKWVIDTKGTYVYDENLNCTLNTVVFWDPINNEWLDWDRNEITYDAHGNMTSLIYNHWDNYAKQWNIEMNVNFEYDASGNCTLEYYHDLNETTNQWEIRRKYLYYYDADNIRTSELYMRLDEVSGLWVFANKEEYSYDANGKITGNNLFYWNDLTSVWINNMKQAFTYDSAGNNILFQELGFYFADSTWSETRREENTYDVNRNPIVQVQNDWGVITKTENTFNNSYSSEDLILPVPYPGDYFRHMWIKSLDYSYSGIEWVPESRTTFVYNEVNTSDLPFLEDKDISPYPNPASQFVSFDAYRPLTSATLSLFDMQGRKVMTAVVDNNIPVSIKQLDKGLYIYRISDDGTDYKGKLVIE